MLSAIQREAILREQIRKEKQTLQFRTTFSTNPKLLQRNFVTAKLGSTQKAADHSVSTEDMTAEAKQLVDQMKTSLQRFDLGPREKNEFPETRAQEYGWFWNEPNASADPIFRENHGLKSSNITLFADMLAKG
jgi:hypothetical protein